MDRNEQSGTSKSGEPDTSMDDAPHGHYHETDDGDIIDPPNCTGIVSGDKDVEWVTPVSPALLRQWAELVEFCYPEYGPGGIGIGLVRHPDDDGDHSRMLVAGVPGADQIVAVAPRILDTADDRIEAGIRESMEADDA